ncbi:TIGR03862 family flavoprotein [Undibacterium umbellatum]|uniref:TIGR03862 family flavoprotein n=1 Tax=Undibacterium umbellatum TaxID=2762300 RepID=A0ABR6ZF71_9BURK|nr:TIGR03862 family flavoprotein [Undibacterium umbellatum]MBC3910387.1 TIGR03862 family flavoprotein [Undibacterium umbellatum]
MQTKASNSHHPQASIVAIIGGGPAGLMAAETLALQGIAVDVYDAMPSVGRKFLMAGKGGMNLTHSEDSVSFMTRYAERELQLAPIIDQFDAAALRVWVKGLGIETYVGSSGRVFPVDMKAAPLLRAWLHRLRQQGVRFHMRHRWLGWDEQGQLRFATPDGEVCLPARAQVFALGGGSWPRLGSDGAWVSLLRQRGLDVADLQPANCGFDVNWTAFFKDKFAGQPLLTVAAKVQGSGQPMRKGQFVITESGVEGSLIYALSAALRQQLHSQGKAVLELDLLPDTALEKVQAELEHPRGSRSLSSHLKSRLGLDALKMALLHECLDKTDFAQAPILAQAIKALPVVLNAARPIDEAISSAGGLRFEELDENLMALRYPGLFFVGEMLDWEAPTGGYLLTACFATARLAAAGVANWLEQNSSELKMS